jgi:glycosyltransferase involved in cell wall biosynthesis
MTELAIVIPARDVAGTIERVIDEIPPELHGVTLVVDDGSTDDTGQRAAARGVAVLRHDRSRGYGAAQKTGYAWAQQLGAQRVVLLHGDGQYPTADVLGLASALDDADCALGSRFLGAASQAAVPPWRRWGNRALTGFANWRWGEAFSELHTGARAFRVALFTRVELVSLSDNYLFDQQLLVALIRADARFVERPIAARYDDSVQSISFPDALRYGIGCLWTLSFPGDLGR